MFLVCVWPCWLCCLCCRCCCHVTHKSSFLGWSSCSRLRFLFLLHHERTSHTTQFAVWSGNCRLGGQNQFLVDGKPSRTRRITPHRRRQRLEHGCRPSEQHASVWRREWFDLCIDQQWCGETIETKRTKAQWRSLWHGHVRLD